MTKMLHVPEEESGEDATASIQAMREAESAVFAILPQNLLFSNIRSCLQRCLEIQEPERTGRLANVIQNSRFDFVCVSVILLNCVFAGHVADWEVGHPGGVPPLWM